MRRKEWLILAAVTLLLSSVVQTQSQSAVLPTLPSAGVQIIDNSDVLMMVKRGMKADAIIARIRSSRCNFDVFPPVLQDLKRRGVPELVLQTMLMVPNGPAASTLPDVEPAPATARVKMPLGFPIKIETLYPVSSEKIKVGGTIPMAVVEPVYIDGALVVARGTVARARILSVKRAKPLGRGGSLTWRIDEILAIDGTKIPVHLSSGSQGDNHAGQMAAGAAVTSALVFPYTAPAALVWMLKKGDDAVVRGSKQFNAVSSGDIELTGLIPDQDRLIYHYAEALKAKASAASTPTAFPRLPVRN